MPSMATPRSLSPSAATPPASPTTAPPWRAWRPGSASRLGRAAGRRLAVTRRRSGRWATVTAALPSLLRFAPATGEALLIDGRDLRFVLGDEDIRAIGDELEAGNKSGAVDRFAATLG